jgi:hypothetical protein
MKALHLIAAAALAAGGLFMVGAASAQTASPTRLRGTISAVDGKSVTIATREGASVKVGLAKTWSVLLVSKTSASDIKPGSFVGVASTGTDADRTALEVLVFPEAARGSGEGHYPWDLQPRSMMTNATVATVAAGSDGERLKLDYKGGTQTIKVKPGTPIVTFAPASRSDATVGAKVFATATKAPDGSLTAARLLVGKDGLTPPM